jgi:hypothetical protein
MTCRRAGEKRGGSDACSACSGSCADHGDMRLSRGRARFEAHGPPAARPLKCLPDLSRQMVTKGSAAHVKEQRPGERKLEAAQPSAPARVVSAIARCCRPSPLLLANGAPAGNQQHLTTCSLRSQPSLLHTGDAPHPTTIQMRARAMNGAAHRERWVGREGLRTSERSPIVFSILQDRDPPSPLTMGAFCNM